jgi:pilus assembly protein CpaD
MKTSISLGVRLASLGLTASLLVACATPAPAPTSNEVERSFPIQVSSRIITHTVAFDGSGMEIAPASRTELDTMLHDFMRVGGGVLEIAVASESSDDTLTEQRREAVRQYARRSGVQPYELRFSQLRTSTGRSGTVVVSYERFTAQAPDCTENVVDTAFNPSNKHHPNFGCFIQSQLATMVSNPADLTRSHTITDTDAMGRGEVIRKHRLAQPTGRARGVGEDSTSIRDLN